MSLSKAENRILEERMVGVLRCDDLEIARQAALAAIEGGLQVLEITMTLREAPELIEWVKKKHSHVLVGAGTVLNKQDADKCKSAGAEFFVSPNFDPQVNYALANELYIPGVLTPTEMMAAYQSQRRLQKVFPANILGASGIKAVLGPLPFINLFASGGVSEENYQSYFEAGVKAIALGGELFNSAEMKKKNFKSITEKMKAWKERLDD